MEYEDNLLNRSALKACKEQTIIKSNNSEQNEWIDNDGNNSECFLKVLKSENILSDEIVLTSESIVYYLHVIKFVIFGKWCQK